jgi:hypothetical protein
MQIKMNGAGVLRDELSEIFDCSDIEVRNKFPDEITIKSNVMLSNFILHYKLLVLVQT